MTNKKIYIITMMFMFFLALPIVSAQIIEDIVSYYKLNEASGTIAVDANQSNNATYNGTLPNAVNGLIGNGQNFSANVGDGVFTPLSFNEDGIQTYSLWFNTQDTNSSEISLLGDGQPGNNDKFGLYLNGSGNLIVFTGTGGQFTPLITGSSDLRDGEWHQAVVIFDGNTNSWELYEDGTSLGTATQDPFSSGTGIRIGKSNSESSRGNRIIDEVGIWNRILNDSEVLSIYDAGLTGIGYPNFFRSVILNSPADGLITIDETILFNASIRGDETNVTNATLKIWNSTGGLYAENSTIFSGTNNQETAIFNQSGIDFGDYTWNVEANFENSTGFFTQIATNNRSFGRQRFSEQGKEFDSTIYDTDSSEFVLNISTDESAELFSSSLVYNGTSYLANIENLGSGDYSISREIDIPETDEEVNRSFFWEITLSVGGVFSVSNSTSSSQNVKASNFSTSQSDGTINFTLLHEEDLEEAEAQFDANFEWYLGSGTVVKNSSFQLDKDNSFLFNSTPNNQTMFLSATIDLTNATTGINTSLGNRLIEFNKIPIVNDTTQIDLLLPNSSRSSNVIIEVKDEGLSPIVNTLVEIYRFYPGIGEYKKVESRITDNFGQFSADLVENEEQYRFSFFNLDNELLKEESSITISCRSTICVLPFVIEDSEDVFARFSNIEGFEYDFTFSTQTNTTSFTWNDVTNDFSSARLEVTKYEANGSTTVCNVDSSSETNTLSCDVGSEQGSYVAEIFRTDSSGDEIRIDSLSFEVANPSDIFGLEGMMWSFILLFLMVAIGAYSPIAGIVLYLFGFLGLSLVGILYIHPAMLIAQIIIGVLFIWSLR